jgi:hypothetical protein
MAFILWTNDHLRFKANSLLCLPLTKALSTLSHEEEKDIAAQRKKRHEEEKT